MPQLLDLLFAPDDERRALGQVYNRGHRRTLAQEPSLDQAEALGLVGPQIEGSSPLFRTQPQISKTSMRHPRLCRINRLDGSELEHQLFAA
jgi:hypothetical protein